MGEILCANFLGVSFLPASIYSPILDDDTQPH